jgi:hypothetical protein
MQFPFGMLAPDQTDLAPGVMLQADGVQPLRDGYGPYPSVVTASTATALPGAPRGLVSYQTADGSWALVAATQATIQKMNADFTWTEIESGLDVTAGDDMCFARFGTKLLYSNTTDGMRAYDVEAGGVAAVTTAKAPRWFFECGNLLFGLDCLDSAGNRDNRLIRSSAFSDHTNWTTKGADYQPLESGGALIWGGRIADTSALVLQESAVRLIQVGNVGNALWGIQSVSEEFGAVGAKSCVSFDGTVWWWGTDGLRMFSLGQGITRPLAGKMDDWFLRRVDQSELSLIQGTIDPFRKNVMWRWKRASNSSRVVFEDIIGYNWEHQKPFTLTMQTTYIGFSAQTALTWDGYEGVWDDAEIEWDSRLFQGGEPLFGVLGADYKFGYLAGPSLAATLETAISPSPVSRLIAFARPEDDSADGTLELGVRTALSDATTWKTGVTKATSGRAALRGRGKYIGFRRNITAGSSWTLAKGVDHIEAAGRSPR